MAGDEGRSERGVEGPAARVVEIRSPHDETDAELAWYARHGAAEILVVDPTTRTAELHVSRDAKPVLVQPDAGGILRLSIGASLRRRRGGRTAALSHDGGRAGTR